MSSGFLVIAVVLGLVAVALTVTLWLVWRDRPIRQMRRELDTTDDVMQRLEEEGL